MGTLTYKDGSVSFDSIDYSRFKTTLVIFSNNTYALTQDDIHAYLKEYKTIGAGVPTPVLFIPVKGIPDSQKPVSLSAGVFPELPPKTPPAPVMGCPEGSVYRGWVILLPDNGIVVSGGCMPLEQAEIDNSGVYIDALGCEYEHG